MGKSTVRVVARVVAKPEKLSELKALLIELVEPTRQESGCIAYELLQNDAMPTEFVFLEEWESEAAMQAHLASEHVQEAFREGEDLLASPPLIHHYHVIL